MAMLVLKPLRLLPVRLVLVLSLAAGMLTVEASIDLLGVPHVVSAEALDSDGDLLPDDVEIACGSDPFDFNSRCDEFCGLPKIDVWNSADPNNFVLVGQIETIKTAQTGAQHYNLFSASGHPTNVNLDGQHANIWVHQDTGTDDLTFGFIFGKDNSGAPRRSSSVNFRIVGSDTDPFVSQSDDAGEAVETPPQDRTPSSEIIGTSITPMGLRSAGSAAPPGPSSLTRSTSATSSPSGSRPMARCLASATTWL